MKNWREVFNCILYPMRGKSNWQGRMDIGGAIAQQLATLNANIEVLTRRIGGDA